MDIMAKETINQKSEGLPLYKKIIIALWAGVVIFLLSVGVALYGISQGWLGELPSTNDLMDPINKSASRVYTDDGVELCPWGYAQDNRVMVPYDSLPDNLIKALVATEDVRFYEHSGIDLKALGRAIIKRGVFGQKSAGGGSTITQQLAKQLYSDVAKDASQRAMQKPIEWFIAIELERYYTKEEIIAMYLNKFDFLNNAVGIKNAARTYFSKEPWELSLTECATLVGMCKNPSYFNPRRFNERSRERRNVVLSQMQKAGYITKDEMLEAQKENLSMEKFHVLDHNDGMAPYFREFLRQVLMAKKPNRDDYRWREQEFYNDSLAWETDPLYGWCTKNKKKDGSNYNIYTDGLKIFTTIDSRMQRYAEQAVYDHVAKELQPLFDKEKKGSSIAPYSNFTKAQFKKKLDALMKQSDRYRTMKADGCSDEEIEEAFYNIKVPMTIFTYDGEKEVEMTPMDSIRYYKSFLRTSMMAMDPRTGAVKAYVGGLNYKHFQYDNVTIGQRQIGSTMKPYLYAFAMENGYTPCSEFLNTAPTYDDGVTVWTPRNDSKAREGEIVTLGWGLAQSNNWITARLMIDINNPLAFVKFIRENVGLRNLKIKPTMSLCLGTCEVSVSEMVSGYSMFANKGTRTLPLYVTRIEDADGNVIATFKPRVKSAISEEACYKMIHMLRGVVNSGTAGRLRYSSRPYKFTADICGKTGTTTSNADAWFMGVVPKLVVGCWVGGDEPSIHFNSMSNGQGAAAALPIFGNFMLKVFNDKSLGITQEDEFEIPKGFDFCADELSGLEDAPDEEYTEEGVDSSFK